MDKESGKWYCWLELKKQRKKGRERGLKAVSFFWPVISEGRGGEIRPSGHVSAQSHSHYRFPDIMTQSPTSMDLQDLMERMAWSGQGASHHVRTTVREFGGFHKKQLWRGEMGGNQKRSSDQSTLLLHPSSLSGELRASSCPNCLQGLPGLCSSFHMSFSLFPVIFIIGVSGELT